MYWINVKDELPEPWEDVLIYTNKNGGFFDFGYVNSDGYWFSRGSLIVADVLFWAELENPV